MEASHRIPQDPPSAGRRGACHRPRIVQALLKFGCGDLSIRQHSFRKNRDGGMAPRAAVALQPCCEAFSWRPSVAMHLSRPPTRTTSWRQSTDISLSNLHVAEQSRWTARISSESLWGKPKTLLSKTDSVVKMRDSVASQALFSLPRTVISPVVRHASYGNFFITSALNLISVSSQSVTRNRIAARLFPARGGRLRGSQHFAPSRHPAQERFAPSASHAKGSHPDESPAAQCH